jgi:RNA polymerase sigma-70 factor (ECF subfamily)
LAQTEEMNIIKRVLDGDANAFEEIVVANQNNVYRLAFKMTGNREDALDLSQEAFIKAYTNLHSFRGDSRLSVWLYRLTYNLCLDFMRKNSRAKIVSLSGRNDDGEQYDIEIPDYRHVPEQKILQEERSKIISDSIDELPEKHREILVLREISDMSYSDIAALLNISEGTVKSRISRARMLLVSILKNKGTFPENFRLEDTDVNRKEE